jgi:hypothetical protein
VLLVAEQGAHEPLAWQAGRAGSVHCASLVQPPEATQTPSEVLQT